MVNHLIGDFYLISILFCLPIFPYEKEKERKGLDCSLIVIFLKYLPVAIVEVQIQIQLRINKDLKALMLYKSLLPFPL
jgi:hypothetical protein